MLHSPTRETTTETSQNKHLETSLPDREAIPQENYLTSFSSPGKSGYSQAQQHQQLAHLQQAYGNQAVLRMLNSQHSISDLVTLRPSQVYRRLQQKCACGGTCPRCQNAPLVQTKLKISEPGDKYEQEADRIADEVMRMPEPSVQRQVEPGEEEEMVRRKAIANSMSPLSQEPDTSEVPVIVHEVLRSPGQPLDAATRFFMEPRFGHDFSQVQVHTDAKAATSARALNARAYTVGQTIVFGAGQYSPGTHVGYQLLAHELTHTLQQQHRIGNQGRVQRSPDDIKVPEIDEPENVAEWESPTGEDFQWQNPVLGEKFFPERANGLRSFLIGVKELELRGYLGKSTAIAKKEVEAALNAYLAELNTLDEKQLMEKVNEVFEQYEDTGAFPLWLQGAVIRYSGMKYQSAHGSYYSPQKLLSIIKTHELDTADKDEKEMMLAEVSQVLQDETRLDILPGKTKKKIKSDLAGSSLKTLSNAIPKKEQDSLADLIATEDSLWESYLELQQFTMGSDTFKETLQTIQRKEDKIKAMESLFSKNN